MTLETKHINGRDDMHALREARRQLFVPHTYIDPGSYGFTTVHSQLPNQELRRLTDTGSEQEPSLRIRDRKGTRFLYAMGGFACSLKLAGGGSYKAVTSVAYYDLDGLPYGPEGYTLKQFNKVDIANPLDAHPRDINELLEHVAADNTGSVSYGTCSAEGIQLATEMAEDISSLIHLRALARISEAFSRKVPA